MFIKSEDGVLYSTDFISKIKVRESRDGFYIVAFLCDGSSDVVNLGKYSSKDRADYVLDNLHGAIGAVRVEKD